MDENNQSQSPVQPEIKKRLSFSERRAAKKQKRMAKRRAERDAFDQAGLFGRTWIVLKNIVRVLFSMLLLAVIIFGAILLITYFGNQDAADALLNEVSVTPEEVLAFAPVDEKKSAAVDAMKQYPSDDTWAVYVYVCGSNLESSNISELSEFVSFMAENEYSISDYEETVSKAERIQRFVSEMEEQGMTLPEYMYIPRVGNGDQIESGVKPNPLTSLLQLLYSLDDSPRKQGSGYSDIKEMTSVPLSDKLQIVIQTGGSSSWSTPKINPNLIQRFVYNSNGFDLAEEMPTRSMSEQSTLEDFLAFCKNGYPADHKMLILWNHGAGPFGVCQDEIFGKSLLSLMDIRTAIENVYPNAVNPPYEVIGFDACLMATMEVAKALEGLGKYLVASQEVEPGDGWAHVSWVQAITDNPGTNGAQLGKAIVDGYMDFYAADAKTKNALMGADNVVTLSVTDIAKASKAYDAYEEFAGKILKDSFKNPSVLSFLGSSAARSVRYADTAYDLFNLVDAAIFMDNLSAMYPQEASAIANAVRDSVLYTRASNYEKESQGLSIYLPVSAPNSQSLNKYTQYIYDICLSPNVQALYYYKLAGCLNEELAEYAEEAGYGKAPTLNNAPLKTFRQLSVTPDSDGNFSIELSEDVVKLIQSSTLELATLNSDYQEVIYYGRDAFCGIDANNWLYTDFDCKWISIDGNHIPVELIGSSNSSNMYRCRALVNGNDSYVIIGYDIDTDTYSVIGVSPAITEEIANTAHRNTAILMPGDIITPVFKRNSIASDSDQAISLVTGDGFIYKENSVIADTALGDGEYLYTVVVTDARGDEFYMPVIGITVEKGKVVKAEQSLNLVGTRK